MSEVKYYNNNPCKVLREVGEGFSEVVVYPHVQDLDMNGGVDCGYVHRTRIQVRVKI